MKSKKHLWSVFTLLILWGMLPLSSFSQIGAPAIIDSLYCFDHEQTREIARELTAGDICDTLLQVAHEKITVLNHTNAACDSNVVALEHSLDNTIAMYQEAWLQAETERSKFEICDQARKSFKWKSFGTNVAWATVVITLSAILIKNAKK